MQIPTTPTIEWARDVWQDMRYSHERHHLSSEHKRLLAQAESEHHAKLEREKQEREQASIPPHAPDVRVTSRSKHGDRALMVIEFKPSEDGPPADSFRVQYRAKGKGWQTWYRRFLPGEDTFCMVRLTVKDIAEVRAGAKRDMTSWVWSEPLTVPFTEQKQKRPEPQKQVTAPTDEEIRAYLKDGASLKNEFHPVVRRAVNAYQRKEQKERLGALAKQAERDREKNQADRKAFEEGKKLPERLKSAPPSVRIIRETNYSVLLEISKHQNNMAERFQLCYVRGDGKTVASGTSYPRMNNRTGKREDLPVQVWRRKRDVEVDWFILGSNKYGQVKSTIVKSPTRRS